MRSDPLAFWLTRLRLGELRRSAALQLSCRYEVASAFEHRIHNYSRVNCLCRAGATKIIGRQMLREVTMPYYEYLCQDCNKKFSLALTVAEHDKGKIKCPKCGSSKLEQQWAAFYATTSKKS